MSMNLFDSDSPSKSQEERQEQQDDLEESSANNANNNSSSFDASAVEEYDYKHNHDCNGDRNAASPRNNYLDINHDDRGGDSTIMFESPRESITSNDSRHCDDDDDDDSPGEDNHKNNNKVEDIKESQRHYETNCNTTAFTTEISSIMTATTGTAEEQGAGTGTNHPIQGQELQYDHEISSRSIHLQETSIHWSSHHMEEAIRMTRDVEKCLDDLDRIQVQNAILMDHLVMAGADL
jgi:hypothetical protein